MASMLESRKNIYGSLIFWRIENFQYKPNENVTLSSPYFEIKGLGGKWQLEVKRQDKFLAAHLFKESSYMRTKVYISVSLLTESGWINVLQSTEVTYEAYRTGWGEHKLINLQSLEKQKSFFMPRESLTISFHAWNSRTNENSTSQKLIISQMDDSCNLNHQPVENFSCLTHEDLLYFLPSYKFPSSRSLKVNQVNFPKAHEYNDEDILKLLKRKNLGFVTIRTPNRDFFALKAIFCVESPVLKNILLTTNNDDSNLVHINDADSDTMSAVITFLHYKTLKGIDWDMLKKLFEVADKYQIGRLRRFCVSFVKQELNVENFCDALTLADRFQNKQLMTYVQKYFCENSDCILQSELWEEFSKKNSELISKTLKHFTDSPPQKL